MDLAHNLVSRCDNPDTVSLVANATQNTTCSDSLWVNFICEASEANPPVLSYQLFKNGQLLNTATNGTWIREISEAGKHSYSCGALHFLGNVNSSNGLTITFYVPEQPSVIITSGSLILSEGGNLSLFCSAYNAYTEVNVTWLKLNANGFPGLSNWLNFTNIGRNASGDYICIANNTCGKRNSSRMSIDVQYKPDHVSLKISTNKVCAGMMLTFTCLAGAANPAIQNYVLQVNNGSGRVNVSSNQVGVFTEIQVTEGQHTHTCEASNSVGRTSSSNSTVVVQVLPSVAIANERIVVLEGGNVTLRCGFSGFPLLDVSWINENFSLNYIMDAENILVKLNNISRYSDGVYTCLARNACGNDSKNVDVDVQYPVEATRNGTNYTVAKGEEENITCPVDGNPKPNIKWYKGSEEIGNPKTTENVLTVKDVMESVCYTCVASNSLGTPVSISHCLIVVDPTVTMVSSTTVSQLNTSAPSIAKPTRSGTEGLAGRPWTIIGAVTGGVVVLAIVVGFLTWWVHKQRKCKRDTKIHNSDQGRHGGEVGCSQVQGAYAQSGPPAANGTASAAEQQIEAEAAIPTYAAVDKSKKGKKQADERPLEYAVVDKSQKKEKQEVAAVPTYAAVDKSKKKKKSREEVTTVYAEVDKSKKKKKKKIDDKNLYENLDEPNKEKKPGELLYADLGDFQNPSMPAVSISPQPLPAIKKADPYERTDYADITQFLKGNATLPPNDGNGDTEMKPKRPSKNKIQGNDKETPI